MKVTLREKPLNNGTKHLFLDIYHSGKRRKEYLQLYLTRDREQNKQIKKLAENIRDKRSLELANDEYGFSTPHKKKISFIDYFENIEKQKPKHSIYYSTLEHIKAFSKGKLFFYEIDEKWLDGYRGYLINLDSISQNTAREYFSVTKRILRRAVKEKIIIRNPADYVDSIKATDIKRDFLTIDEIQLLANNSIETDFDIKRGFLFSCFTGLRYSDVKNLKWMNIRADHIELKQQKTGDHIYIPLHPTAKQILFGKTDNIIPLPDKNVFKIPYRWYANNLLKKLFEKAKINKNAHWHLSRHTFAVLNITMGAEFYTLSKLLGHKNMKTTEIYSKLIDKKKQEAINRLPVIEVGYE